MYRRTSIKGAGCTVRRIRKIALEQVGKSLIANRRQECPTLHALDRESAPCRACTNAESTGFIAADAFSACGVTMWVNLKAQSRVLPSAPARYDLEKTGIRRTPADCRGERSGWIVSEPVNVVDHKPSSAALLTNCDPTATAILAAPMRTRITPSCREEDVTSPSDFPDETGGGLWRRQ